jgi:hypothetical protein
MIGKTQPVNAYNWRMRRYKPALLMFVMLLLIACTPGQQNEQVTVISHPDGPLYAGDQISFEVLEPAEKGNEPGSVEVSFNDQPLGSAGFAPYGLGLRNQATLWWIWDTRNLGPGRYTLTFTRRPENETWEKTFTLHPANQVPAPEPGAHWVSTTSNCCTLYYITGTAAERDIATLTQEADRQSADVSAQLGSSLEKRIDIVIMSRVVGHGGYTWNGIYTSYLEDNYVGNDMSVLFHHEFVHYYDQAMGGNYLPAILQEGLAVYLTGGHFKPELLGPRAAGLFQLGQYLPLSTISDDFYKQQHDISYLEAGALVEYLVETYGWGAYNEFYRSIPAPENTTVSGVLGSALQDSFGISFSDLETGYRAFLQSQPVSEEVVTDLQLTISFFDSIRRYQLAFDPSAYFLTAWLPDASTMRERGIVADLLRHPNGWKNRLFESLLIRSQKELFNGDYPGAAESLGWTEWILNIVSPR